MSRNTVDRLLELVVPPRYVRPAKGSALDPFIDEIVAMLEENPKARRGGSWSGCARWFMAVG